MFPWRIALDEKFWLARHPPRYAAFTSPSSPTFLHSSGKVTREFVVAGGNTAEVHEAAEHRLDPPAIVIAPLVQTDLVLASAGARNDHADALLTQVPAQTVGIVALSAIGQHTRPCALAGMVSKVFTSSALPRVWVDRFNTRRLLEPVGNIPPAEAEARYYAQAEIQAWAA